MICELRNKAMDVLCFTMEGKTQEYMRVGEVTLLECVAMVFLAILAMMFISWWWIPLRAILRPVLEKKFYCKRNRP